MERSNVTLRKERDLKIKNRKSEKAKNEIQSLDGATVQKAKEGSKSKTLKYSGKSWMEEFEMRSSVSTNIVKAKQLRRK